MPTNPSSLLDAADNHFAGRARLADDVSRLLRGGRSAVLVGCPGVGKTRLAAECLRALDDETVVVGKLGEVRDRRGLLTKVAEAIGLWLAPALAIEEVEARVGSALAALRPTIVALDPFEHLPADADALLAGWMRTTAVSWLVTSRRRIAAEIAHVEVTPLGTHGQSGWSEAAILMRRRAEEIARVRVDEADHDAIDELVTALGGLPLAIELAAARLSVLTPAQLLARLGKRFDVLDGALDDPRRGLAAALEGSIATLDDAGRAGLRACAVFRGGVRLDALEAVLGEGTDVLGALTALRNHSLVSLERVGDVYRYALAPSVRELVEQREGGSAAWHSARARHAAFWAARSESEDLSRDVENLRAGFEWARDHDARSCAMLALLLSAPGLGEPYGVAAEVVSVALAQVGLQDLDGALRAALFFRRGTIRRFVGDFAGAIEDLQRALALAKSLDDRALMADVLAGWGNALSGQADWAGARRKLERAMAVHPSPSFRSLALAMIANTFSNEDAYHRAELLLRDAIEVAERAGDAYAGAFARLSLGISLVERGVFDDAYDNLLDALAVLETSRSTRVMQARHLRAVALTHVARVKQETGDRAGALTDYHEALAFADEAGVQRARAFALHGLASLLLELGELRAADDRLREALPLMRQSCKDVEGALVALQGVLFALRGGHEDAERFFRRAESLLEAHERPVFSVALSVLRGRTDGAGPFAGYADVLLARRLRALIPERRATAPLLVGEDAAFFRVSEAGDEVSLVRRKAVRGVFHALVEARLSRPGTPVPVEALVAAGWPGERMISGAGTERVYAAIATLRRMGLRGLILQQGDGYLLPPDRPVLRHDPRRGVPTRG